jgi:AraC-like DNA-binding protein
MIAWWRKRAEEVMGPLFAAGIKELILLGRKPFPPPGTPHDGKNVHRIRLQLEGRAELKMNGATHTLNPGDLVVLPEGMHFTYGGVKKRWCWFGGLLIGKGPRWEWLRDCSGIVRGYESADLMYLLMQRILNAYDCQRLIDSTSGSPRSQGAREDCYTLLSLIKRELRTYAEPRPDKRLSVFRELMAQIREDPGQDWTVSRMAKLTYQSRSSLSRMCKGEYGMGPREVVVKHRVALAASLLSTTNYSFEAIARTVGYKSAGTFSTLFKKHVGCRPSDFRGPGPGKKT